MGYTQKLGLLAQSVFQDSSLNVGIGGAPSGSYKFEVTGTTKVSGITSLTSATASTSTTTGALVVTGGIGIGGALFGTGGTFSQDIASLGGQIASVKNGSNTQGSGAYFLLSNAASNQLWYQQLNASNGLDYWYNGSIKLTIASTGAATFSSTITTAALSRIGDLFIGGRAGTYVSYPDGIFGDNLHLGATGTGGAVYVNSLLSRSFIINPVGGNVGIGATPLEKLWVNLATNVNFAIGGTTRARILGVVNANDNFCDISLEGSNVLFFSAGTEKARITSAGALQVSKNTLSDSVQIFSNVSNGTGTTGQISLNNGVSWYAAPQSGGTYYSDFGGDSAGLGYRWSTYSGSYAYRFFFYANGTAYNSTGTWGNSSDIKLKQDIVDANPQWDDIKALKFKKYRLKKDVETELESTDGYVAPVHFGLIAQEVELTSPGLIEDVIEGDSTTKMIKTSIMLMKSVKALQEAMTKIESLQEQINELKNK